MKVKYANGGGVGDPVKDYLDRVDPNRLGMKVENTFGPMDYILGSFPLGRYVAPAVQYGAGYLSKLSPAAAKVMDRLGAGRGAKLADDAFTDHLYSGRYTPDPDSPFPVDYPSDFMPYGRGEQAATNLLERRALKTQRNKAYADRMAQLKELYTDTGREIPNHLVDLARARRAGNKEAIKRLERLNQAEIDKAMQRIADDLPADAMDRARYYKTDDGKKTAEMLKELRSRMLKDQ